MLHSFRKGLRGFTLIELLVVIAIIGLLASIVLVSLSTARRKARDSRRVGDLRQVQLALELYFDASSEYPGTEACALPGCTHVEGNTMFGTLGASLAPAYLGGLPTDPTNSAGTGTDADSFRYQYVPGGAASPTILCVTATDSCLHYALGVSIEETTNPSLSNDLDNGAGGFVWNTDGISCADPTYCVGA